MTTYRIPALNFPRLEAEVERMNKRAERNSLEPLTLKILEEIEEPQHHQSLGFDHHETVYVVSIEGEIPRLEGWTLVARIEPQKETDEDTGENIVREVPGCECPAQYRTTDMGCDHCGVNVKRNHVWILHNESTGEYRQVGGSCFKDFFGGVNPDAVLRRAENSVKFADLVKEAQTERWGREGNNPVTVIPIESFVTVVALLSRQLGWVPKSKSNSENPSTASTAWDVCLNDGTDRIKELIEKHGLECRQDDIETADRALTWAKALDPQSAASTYLHDLGVACRQPYVTLRRSGYVASVLVAYERNAAEPQQEEAERVESKHLGDIKERRVFENVTIEDFTVFDSDYGEKTWVRFVDPDGNVIKWKATGSPHAINTPLGWVEKNRKLSIKGTITKHDEFRGEKQTVINRVTPEETEE